MEFSVSDFLNKYELVGTMDGSFDDQDCRLFFHDLVSTKLPNLKNAQFLSVATPKVFPRTLTINHTKTYLIWDLSFWMFFEKYIDLINFANSPSYESTEIVRFAFIGLYAESTSLMLYGKCDLAEILYYYAKLNQKKANDLIVESKREMLYLDESTKETIRDLAEQFVILHEFEHLYYKHANCNKKKDAEHILCVIYEMLKNPHPDLERTYSSLERETNGEKAYFESLNSIVDLLGDHTDSLEAEEIMCDFFACTALAVGKMDWLMEHIDSQGPGINNGVLNEEFPENFLEIIQESIYACMVLIHNCKHYHAHWSLVIPTSASHGSCSIEDIERFIEPYRDVAINDFARMYIMTDIIATYCVKRYGVSGVKRRFLHGSKCLDLFDEFSQEFKIFEGSVWNDCMNWKESDSIQALEYIAGEFESLGKYNRALEWYQGALDIQANMDERKH
jgi:hypothetical protein